MRKEGVGRAGRRWEEGTSWDSWWPGLDLILCITWGLPLVHVQAINILLGSECLGDVLYLPDACVVASGSQREVTWGR